MGLLRELPSLSQLGNYILQLATFMLALVFVCDSLPFGFLWATPKHST